MCAMQWGHNFIYLDVAVIATRTQEIYMGGMRQEEFTSILITTSDCWSRNMAL
jgi:hypothetical protein